MQRRQLLQLLSLAPLAGAGVARAQGSWPSGPIRIIVPVLAGGTVDITTRALAKKLSTALGQTVIVENRTGGAGVPAALAAMHAKPDGNTLFMGTIGTIGVNPLLMLNPPYDPQRDFTPISTVADVPGVLVVNPQVPVNTVAELIAYAKQHPGQLNFGSPGNGSSPHIAGELFKQRAGIDIVHVPYAGASQVMVDVLSGRVQMFFDNIITSLPHIKTGKLRALAVTADRRSNLLPGVPTVSESGLPGYSITGWMGLMGPAGLPPAVTARLSEEVRKIAKLPEMPQEVIGADWTGSTPEEFARFIKAENDRWAAVIKAGNITRQ